VEDRAGVQASERVVAVIVNYNAGEALSECVASLASAGVSEIVVVDNKSSDGSAELAAREFPHIKTLFPTRNLGYGGGANFGAKNTAGEYILVCNPDLIVRPGGVAALESTLDNRPEIALTGPMLLESSGVVYPSGREFPGMGEAIGHGFLGLFWGGNPWTKRYRHIGSDQHTPRLADWVSGAFFLVRRDAFESVGGFDDRYFMYVEDVDLCWRLKRKGWEIWYDPTAQVVHEQGLSASQHPYKMLVAHHLSMWRFARQTAEGWDRALLPIVALGIVLRLVLSWGEHLVRWRSRVASRHG
jgi:N-acetylglucosaminyl-diphospho-decaprenol L-rhamnosyltransferase